MGLRHLCLAALLVLSVPGSAYADPGVTTSAVNVRSGAGVGHQRIGVLPPDAAVSIDRCGSGWCYVTAPGVRGWISARFLRAPAATSVSPEVPRSEIRLPTIVTPPLVVPRRDIHRYGHGDQHRFQRPFD